MAENRFEKNANFGIYIGGYYAFVNISSNNFTDNTAANDNGLITLSSMEKELFFERNILTNNYGQWMFKMDIKSHSLREKVLAWIGYNYFTQNQFLHHEEDYVDNWPRSFAIGIFGAQVADVHFNRLWNTLFDFELISGVKTLLVNMPVLLLSANDYCEKNWWTNFLYVNNFVHYDKQCYTPSWYLAVDFQLYLFSPILLVPLALKPTVGFCIAGLLLLFSTIFNFATVYTEYFPRSDFSGAMDPRMGPASRYRLLIYDAPWIRCQVYIVGILVGYLLQTKKTLRIPKVAFQKYF